MKRTKRAIKKLFIDLPLAIVEIIIELFIKLPFKILGKIIEAIFD